ncbi:hypothetical protein FA13DRAFT_1738433 [Coprinellus micaceus]|uniref:Uncharacterized protein n=1 Tax=Coprinellus micaceus TaxID=71717 RepID=A0A4Y7STT7_COPMI|nr:hypothetical protein FA13DRAFT_1738433 [Coprinellus micaceus]
MLAEQRNVWGASLSLFLPSSVVPGLPQRALSSLEDDVTRRPRHLIYDTTRFTPSPSAQCYPARLFVFRYPLSASPVLDPAGREHLIDTKRPSPLSPRSLFILSDRAARLPSAYPPLFIESSP